MNTTAPTSLHAKTILITGATSGIGLEVAVALACTGAQIVITGRSPARIEAALATLHARTGANAEGLCADFASQADVRKLAAEFKASHDRLDILINNAGSVNATHTLTVDGIETTFAVNHLAPFLLTRLLLDRLLASAPARIVNVASVAHTRGTLDFNDIGFAHGYSIMRAYSRSKLANVLFTRALAKRLADTGVTVNALHPGTVATGIWGHGAPGTHWKSAVFKTAFAGVKLFMQTPARGAETIVHAATAPDLAGRTGLYLEKKRPKQPAPLARDDALAERLWTESARLTQLPAE